MTGNLASVARIALPWPPTTNQLHTVVGGRKILSKRGRQYHQAVAEAVLLQRPARFGSARVRVTLDLHPPDRRKRDLANFEKAAIDGLVRAGVLDDDSQIDELRLKRWPKKPGGHVMVTIEAIP